jgi:prepilin-type N-terminal cleavage/methylation domain-containing protein
MHMNARYRDRSGGGFSLVEILIAVMILGIGLVMVAGAFPVGLRYFKATADETTAGLLARSVLSQLQAMRTEQYLAYEQGGTEWPRAEAWGQVAVDECFREDTTDVVYLWDTGAHNSGGPGSLLADQGLGADVDDWMPVSERTSGVDDRFGCQVFYKRMNDPLGNSPSTGPTYEVFLVVQKVAEGLTATDWHDRFPRPSPEVTLASGGTTVTWPSSSGFTVLPGAFLYEVGTGNWAEVAEVNGSTLRLNRSLAAGKVRAINYCVSMFRGVVTKEALR